MIRWTTLFVFSVLFVIACSGPVHASGGVSMTMEPSQVEIGKTSTVSVDVDPAGGSLNIIQATVTFDPAVWNAMSCAPHESFQGIAGKSGCILDNATGVVRLQMETRSTRGPKQKTRVATIVMSRKGSGSDGISMSNGQIVVQDDSGKSSLLPMPGTVTLSGGKEKDGTTISESGGVVEKDTMIYLTPAPLLPGEGAEKSQGFFQSIASWFSRLFRFEGRGR